MELATLAAKQKRVKDWLEFVTEGGVQDTKLKQQVTSAVEQFKSVLVKCWEAGAISSEDEQSIQDLERRLEQLNEEARMTVVGKKTGVPGRVI